MDTSNDTSPTDGPDDDASAHRPSLRQRVHAATGDRDAEAEALLDDAPSFVDEDDAKTAVQRARGEAGADQPGTEGEIATPADAAAIHNEEEEAT